ncbi:MULTISPECIES: hypothetical protein [Spirosoma]|uniref:Uncharacterized protein n=1 Tax=Spirosoma liriopis TaxID=2937440 RepID=A0ABT0HMY9_9BACT|nr:MULTISPECIES: hypothetical protein [Spirosoma]MCK8493528.1 hypothetical protein [Spirosoma liriopis]UHG92966.1 hypothetical protein LQ777_08700 [Spirosoma oryzicola]
MKKSLFASISIQFVNKAVQDAIRRCERIVVVGSSDEYQTIYFFTGQKSYFRYYTIDLNAIDPIVPKRFQQAKRNFYDEVLRREPLAQAVSRVEASQLLNSYCNAPAVSNAPLVQWVKGLLVN